MAQHIIGHCPICKEELVATKLTCKHCGLELSNDFSLNKFNLLPDDDLYFLEHFIKASGNLRAVENQLKISYSAVKLRLHRIQQQLGHVESDDQENTINIVLTEIPIYQDESTVIRNIKEKLNQNHGIASISMARGNTFQIYYEEYGNGIYATNLPHNRIITWKVFDYAVEVIQKNGGKALKGQAMKAKLGEPGLTLDTVEGYVAHYGYNVKFGDSTLRMISPLSAILEWADICINGYGYLQLK